MIYQIELTNHCNSSCEWCVHRHMTRAKGFMSAETFEAVLRDLRKEGIVGGQLGLHHFGEGLLHPGLKHFLDRLAVEGIPWRLSTNGRLLNRPDLRQLLLSSRRGEVVISMENGAKVEDVQALLNEKRATGSRLNVVVQTLSLFSRAYNLEGEYETYTQRCHTWATGGAGVKKTECPFVIKDWAVVLWDGTYVSCCVDAEGESVLGAVGKGRQRNHPWRNCDTCDVAEAFFEPPRGA